MFIYVSVDMYMLLAAACVYVRHDIARGSFFLGRTNGHSISLCSCVQSEMWGCCPCNVPGMGKKEKTLEGCFENEAHSISPTLGS